MRSNYLKATLKTVSLGIIVLLWLTAVSAQVVNLTAIRQTVLTPDGNTVPMWGWLCGGVTGATGAAASGGATCTSLTQALPPAPAGTYAPQAGGAVWQPPLIVVPYLSTGTSLTVNLTNNLPVKTSLTIVGQLGGPLGIPAREAGARADGAHAGQTTTTWTIQTPVTFTPPAQANRARSFGTEVLPGATTPLTWTALKPGTYLIETGTYPSIQGPMGLYGVLVVTTAPATGARTAYSGTVLTAAPSTQTLYSIQYDADVPLLLSEIDPVQNSAVEKVAEVQAGCAINSGACTGTIPDAVETAKWNPTCAASTTVGTGCYPPAVNYTPLHFLVNGLSFDKTSTASSAVGVPAASTTGNVLLRFVNAGVRMHVPSVDGLPMQLIAEDGNVLSDIALQAGKGGPTSFNYNARTQNEVFLPAGKVYDVAVHPAPAVGGGFANSSFSVFDRQLSLSGNGFKHDTGMQAIVLVGTGPLGTGFVSPIAAKAANPDFYIVPAGAVTFTANVLSNDIGINNASSTSAISTAPVTIATSHGSVVLNPDGSFTYTTTGLGSGVADTFSYYGDALYPATVTLTGATIGGTPTARNDSYISNVSSLIKVNAPGVLANDTDPNGYPLKAVTTLNTVQGGLFVTMFADGGFTAHPAAACTTSPGCSYTFTYHDTNSQGTSSTIASVTLTFLTSSNLAVTVQDAQHPTAKINDYKWIIEQDLTFHIDPACQVNTGTAPRPAGCPPLPVPSLGTNFHTSYMPVIAVGCTGMQSCERGQSVYDPASGSHLAAACDGSGNCIAGLGNLPVATPDKVHLAATNPDGTPARYYISILPGDVSNAFNTGNGKDPSVAANCGFANTPTIGTPGGGYIVPVCGHTLGGAPIPPPVAGVFAPVTVNVEPNPLPTAAVTVYVFEDDWPLNGEPSAGGGIDVLASQEPGLGDFQVELWDSAGGSGDATGQMTYDMFNEPLSNSLNGTIDPATGMNACPISATGPADASGNPTNQTAIGTIIVCPRFESDGVTLSALAGQAVIKGLMPGRFGVIVHPGAAREARGEEWLQTNTLDGTHFLDSFVRAGEPNYFQEFGPGGYHVFMGMANPAIINARLKAVCTGPNPPSCSNTVKGQILNLHQARSPNQQLYDSGVFGQGDARNNAALAYTTCYVSLGDPDGATIAFTKCDANGTYTFTGIPAGNYALVVFDQWNDLIVDGTSRAVNVPVGSVGTTTTLNYTAFTWQTHLWTKIYLDANGNGIQDDPASEPGVLQVPSRIRMRNGKFNNFSLTDITGGATFNETFPLFNWYVVESDNTRFRGTGVHVVNDAGGPLDGPAPNGNGNAGPYQGILNSTESFSVPTNLRVPGAVYCGPKDAACLANNLLNTTGAGIGGATGGPGGSTGRIDPGTVVTEGWQGGLSQFDTLEWGKLPYAAGENGGIRGHVVYNSTRPFDDPSQLFQNLWEPLVPRVPVNLYQESTAPDGTTSLKLVDMTTTSSWDDWAQGFRADGATPNMSCPGQDTADPFYSYTLAGTPNYLTPGTTVPNHSQYKCYDGYHNLNQLQPAPYDGLYHFPSAACSAGVGAVNVLLSTGGSGYTSVPNVMISGGAGTGATAVATVVAGVVTKITVISGGSGYTSTPIVTISGGAGTGANAVAINCITQANPALLTTNTSPHTGAAAVVLPQGKYVVEEVTPPGYELVKEEDKNILIGDNFIAPVTNQFGAISNIFIVPDQASISSYNSCYGTGGGCTNPTTDMGHPNPSTFGPGGVITSTAPCVGALRIVPDFMSISPESGEVAPFAGASRHLCDRKEVTLEDQMQAQTDFFIWTKTPAASHFDGFITDDFSSEFDPASPAFGEKFAVPNVPVSVRDFNGVEVSRVYSDQWGTFNGLTFSTFDVDPPNPTGYAPGMMISCMNDPGPIRSNPNVANSPLITDPSYNPAYSNFCYENPYMPADTDYLDTPVVPVSGFAEGYDPPDCAYPDATPAVSTVLGDTSGGGAGPWVSGVGHTLTINSLDTAGVPVPNDAYSGPAATTPPYNQKFVTRHYGFGARGTVTIAGVNATVTAWGDTQIKVTVPNLGAASTCTIQQRGVSTATQCGELVITSGNGRQSIDTVTVTIGGKPPAYVNGENASNNAIQTAIDGATPGDLIIVGPGTYYEMVLMWKPVRLQGVGAGSVIINGNAHPAGKLDSWRKRVNCLFGLALNGQPYSTLGNLVPLPGGGGFEPLNVYDPTGASSCPATGWNAFAGGPNNPQVDRIPLEGVVGWDTTVNGNLAELLQEPSLMGAYEGAGITVLGKGVRFPAGIEVFGTGANTAAGSFIAHESQMPVPTIELTNSAADCNDYPSNFQCNPSRIDGLSITNSSQGGGGIFVHAWGHNLEIANNRIHGNAGTLTGGISIGQGESPDALLSGNGGQPIGYNGGVLAGFDQQPWTCLPGAVVSTTATPYGYDQVVSPPGTYANQQMPFCYDTHVHVHHNAVTSNASYGDELFSASPAGGGGVTFCTGADYYHFNYNWVCGNLSTGDGGGLAQQGFSFNGDISHNWILFNQSFNPTLTTHGGGIAVLGAAPDGAGPTGSGIIECGATTDIDCAPGLSDGTGPGLVIDANLFQGNTAESGSGGGLRLQTVNGTEVQRFPANPAAWYDVSVINNIFANNVAGWTGGGVSLQDALKVNFINNTVVSNDATATAGVLFDTTGAPNATVPPQGCDPRANPNCAGFQITHSNFQPAGLATAANTILLGEAFTPGFACPTGHPLCNQFSNPVLTNNLFWQNRSFHITVGAPPLPVVQLLPALTQATTGSCPSGATYWDIGVYNDTAPSDHSSHLTLHPTYSILTDATDYPGANNLGSNPAVVHQYCNGSRVPPEIAPALCSGAVGHANAPGCIQPGTVGVGMTVPSGSPDNSPPYAAFTLTPAATVDEGNNWINMLYGPLSLSNPTIASGGTGYGVPLGNYSIASGSPAINVATPTGAPNHDFFGTLRPQGGAFDIGAVEFPNAAPGNAPLGFAALSLIQTRNCPGTTSAQRLACASDPFQVFTLTNTTNAPLTDVTQAVLGGANTADFAIRRLLSTCGPAGGGQALGLGTPTNPLAPGGTCVVFVQFQPQTSEAAGTKTATVSVTSAAGTQTSTLSGTAQ